MEPRRFVNPSQPQTLQIAVWLLYFNGVFGVLNLLSAGVFPLFAVMLLAAEFGGGYGIANEKRAGYVAAVLVSFAPFLLRMYYDLPLLGFSLVNLLFEVALVALLLHPQSRDYQRIWFR